MLQLYLFGKPEAYDLRQRPIGLSPAQLTLLAYLWLHRDRPVSRAQLAGTFWPESAESNARRNLRQALHQLRRGLECVEEGDGEYLLLDRSSVRFNAEAAHWVDVEGFESRLERARHRSDDRRGRLLQEAVALCRGRFMAGVYADWALAEADRIQARYVAALQDLVGFHASREEFESAARYARRASEERPLAEEVHRQLIVCYYALGDRDAALRQYRECERRVEADVGAALEPETQELAERIKEGAELDKVLTLIAFPQVLSPNHNLPASLTRFIGRHDEIQTVIQRLREARLVTLTGPGGSGKTRLALEVASQLVERYPDGVRWVDLAPVENPERLGPEIASTVGIHEPADGSTRGRLAEALGEASMLWVLDNAEHLMDRVSEWVGELLRACPHLDFLITSREPLTVDGEILLSVPPLSSPDPEGEDTVEELQKCDAVRLFCERARARLPSFRLTPENRASVAEICRRTDGLPLAIEVAATHMNVLPPERIARNLSDPTRLLRLSRRVVVPRHRTLRATLEWSYQLLGQAEQALFRRLSIFRGGWTRAGAEAIAGGGSIAPDQVFSVLTRLIEKSLVETGAVADEDDEPRYRLLQTVRGFAREKLHDAGEREEVADRHLAFVRALAERAEAGLKGDEQGAWLERLAREHGNVRAALDRALTTAPRAALRMALALRTFWIVRGHWGEGEEVLRKALDRATDVPDQDRAAALRWCGVLARMQGNHAEARELIEVGLARYRAMEDPQGVERTLLSLGSLVAEQGDYEQAQAHYRDALSHARAFGDRTSVAAALNNLGILAYFQGDLDDARNFYRESVTAFREIDDRVRLASVLTNLSVIAQEKGDPEEAVRLQEESLKIRRELGDKSGVAQSLNNLGRSLFLQGRLDDAKRLHEEGLEIRRQLGEKAGEMNSRLYLGNVLRARGDAREARRQFLACLRQASALDDRRVAVDAVKGLAKLATTAERGRRAAQLFGWAEGMRETLNAPLLPTERDDHERHLERLRGLLTDAELASAWDEGQGLAFEDVVKQETTSEPA